MKPYEIDEQASIFEANTEAEKRMIWSMQYGAAKWDFTHVIIYARALYLKGAILKQEA